MVIGMINKFQRKNRWLSNFWKCHVYYEGIDYPSSEHAYQASKAYNLDDRELVAKARTPGDAKRMGKNLRIRVGWDAIKIRIMKEIVLAKFTQNVDLGKQLIETGDQELIEGNTWDDTFWGVCNGVGENHLGKILMEVRDRLNANS